MLPLLPSGKKVISKISSNSEYKIYENSFNLDIEKAIKKTLLFIEQGDIRLASRIICPLFSKADCNQKQNIISSLDPYIEATYQEAYMLRHYDYDRFRNILLEIVKSDLVFLPSFRKATNILEKEKIK